MLTRYFLWSLSSAWMIGIGLRMVIESIRADSIYEFKICFDTFFDWSALLILGIILLITLIYDILKVGEKDGCKTSGKGN